MLFRSVAAVPGLLRLKFTTSHPKDIAPEVIEAFRTLSNLSPQLHLPAQSGADSILAAMGRKYTRERYMGIVRDLRAACPHIALNTDVYQTLIRPSVRTPFMLVSGTVMAYVINRRLASIFLVSIPILIIAIAIVSSKAYPRFGKMLAKYDALNTIIRENLIAIRVVKAFVRGKFECEKFAFSADAVRSAQVSAEKVILWILPDGRAHV